jgi:hypothetical protein
MIYFSPSKGTPLRQFFPYQLQPPVDGFKVLPYSAVYYPGLSAESVPLPDAGTVILLKE